MCLLAGTLFSLRVGAIGRTRTGRLPVAPFHWEIEFPEVFERDNSGFDAIAGNPSGGPFTRPNPSIFHILAQHTLCAF
jgi:hypothetical protein